MNVMNNELIWSPGQNFGVFFLKYYTPETFYEDYSK